MSGDKAPTVYDSEGNPLKLRVMDAECRGDVSGEGHFGYDHEEHGHLTVFFEPADE